MSATGNILIWPAGPITWDGFVGTWPISVWSTGAIGGLAFDTMGLSLTGISLVGMADLAPVPITTPLLNAFMPPATLTAPGGLAGPLAAPVLGPAGVVAPDYGFAGAFDPFVPPVPAFGFGAFAPGIGATEVTMVDGAVAPGFQSWLTPTLTGSALMFTGLTPVDAFTPLTFNVTFTAAQAGALPGATAALPGATAAPALNLANLSIFATPIAPTALTGDPIPFTSMVYPVGVPLIPMPAPLAPAAPVLPPAPML